MSRRLTTKLLRCPSFYFFNYDRSDKQTSHMWLEQAFLAARKRLARGEGGCFSLMADGRPVGRITIGRSVGSPGAGILL